MNWTKEDLISLVERADNDLIDKWDGINGYSVADLARHILLVDRVIEVLRDIVKLNDCFNAREICDMIGYLLAEYDRAAK